ncbi:FtsQ-type POTRA domain-containing protein [Jatrophihabitans sp.]|uniref:cell division protein FtsQ/DivIB n=1 Tax=Jatrophihabitans sp. TaxID=1932789 RepID=UPI0030C714CF|nr:peptidase [Jatrophihabitans sp.]
MSATLLTQHTGDEPPTGGGVPHRRLVIVSAAVVVAGLFAVWLVAFSSVFGVRTIKVSGEHVLSAATIARAADIAHGTPLARLDTTAAEDRIDALPGVASARVSTSFPSTVTITVVERVPLGVVKVAAGYVLVDKTGAQYRTVATRPAGLPLFVVPPGTKTTGGAVSTVAAALGAALRAKIASIQALDPKAITLLMSNGTVVAWGSPDQNSLKARLLPTLLAHGAHQVDVSDPAQPFTR